MLEKIMEAPLIVALIPILIPLINVMSKSKEERLLSQKKERIIYRIGIEILIYAIVICVCYNIPKGAFVLQDVGLISRIFNYIKYIAYLNLGLFISVEIPVLRKYILRESKSAIKVIRIIRIICFVTVCILSIYIFIIVINEVLNEINHNLKASDYPNKQIKSLFDYSAQYFTVDKSLANSNKIKSEILDTTGTTIIMLTIVYFVTRIFSIPKVYIDSLSHNKENLCDIVLKDEKKVSFEMATYIGRNKEFIIIRPKEDPDVMYINVNEIRTIFFYERETG